MNWDHLEVFQKMKNALLGIQESLHQESFLNAHLKDLEELEKLIKKVIKAKINNS